MRPVALTIAGSDSSGGAGIQADLKVFALEGVYGASVVTAVTVQARGRVSGVHPVPAAFVAAQLEAVFAGMTVTAVKTGMLWSGAIVEVLAHQLGRRRLPLVVDPVMVAKGGRRLLAQTGVTALGRRLLPLSTLVTPNLPEAEALVGFPVRRRRDLADAARALIDLGAGAALVKGGHLAGGETVTDFFHDGRHGVELRHPRRRTRHSHGTGCVLSALVTARLAAGGELAAAVTEAVAVVDAILRLSRALGPGVGPADPLLCAATRARSPGTGRRPSTRGRARTPAAR